MPTIVGNSQRVVEADSFFIDEYVGNVASKEDRISIAHVRIAAPTAEPWLTLDYDEWMCVTKGRLVLEHAGGSVEVVAGQTVFIAKGERFRPTFPEGDTEYFPVCLPAFRPDRCQREDDTARESEVSKELQDLHAAAESISEPDMASGAPATGDAPEVLYHMCPAPRWEAAKASGKAYYPPTFVVDGHYTHATGVPSRLIETANHFYQDDSDPWVCLCMTRMGLADRGLFVRDEQALPVGDTPVGDTWSTWVCPHIMGGIPLDAVEAVFPIERDGPRFISIPGIVD